MSASPSPVEAEPVGIEARVGPPFWEDLLLNEHAFARLKWSVFDDMRTIQVLDGDTTQPSFPSPSALRWTPNSSSTRHHCRHDLHVDSHRNP